MNAIFFKGILIQSVRKDNENARNESKNDIYWLSPQLLFFPSFFLYEYFMKIMQLNRIVLIILILFLCVW